MKRYPDGIEGEHFFQKDAPKHMPDWIATDAPRSTATPAARSATSSARS